MAKFIHGSELSVCIEKMIANADQFLYLISPYIKLHDRIRDELKRKKSDDKLQIVVVFGKNEENKSKSLSEEDLSFLKEFPNVKICYEKNLHAKYYASEDSSLITSMNLHQFSQNANIEVGVQMFPKSIVGALADVIKPSGNDCDGESIEYFEGVIKNSEILFQKIPQYETGFLSKTYIASKVEVDRLDDFFNSPKSNYKNTRPNSFNQYQNSHQYGSIDRAQYKTGYCIRTGVQIPFNPEKPLSAEAFRNWNRYADPNYPERFCHFSGEPSKGETCVSKPIMRKNWSKAKELMP